MTWLNINWGSRLFWFIWLVYWRIGLLGFNTSATARVISRRWNNDDEISFLVEETTDLWQVTHETFHTYGLWPDYLPSLSGITVHMSLVEKCVAVFSIYVCINVPKSIVVKMKIKTSYSGVGKGRPGAPPPPPKSWPLLYCDRYTNAHLTLYKHTPRGIWQHYCHIPDWP